MQENHPIYEIMADMCLWKYPRSFCLFLSIFFASLDADSMMLFRITVLHLKKTNPIIEAIVAITEPNGDRPWCRQSFPLLNL